MRILSLGWILEKRMGRTLSISPNSYISYKTAYNKRTIYSRKSNSTKRILADESEYSVVEVASPWSNFLSQSMNWRSRTGNGQRRPPAMGEDGNTLQYCTASSTALKIWLLWRPQMPKTCAYLHPHLHSNRPAARPHCYRVCHDSLLMQRQIRQPRP